MTEKITQVTLDMFKPIEDRSGKTNFEVGRLIGEYLGKGRLRFCKDMRSGMRLPEDLAEGVNTYVLGAIREIHKLPSYSDPQEFYLQQQRQAAEVIEYFGKLLPSVAKDLELKDEISLLSDQPSDLVRLLFRPSDSIDSTLAYEVQRHVLLSHLAAEINARTLNGRLRTCLSDMHHIFNDKLFYGPEGAGDRFYLESFHDDEANEVVGFPNSLRKPPTAHLKRIQFIVRKIPGIGLVYTHPRKKDDGIAVIKSLGKAANYGGAIKINGDVQDSIGMMFVLMEDNAAPEQLADLVVSVIETNPRGLVRLVKVGKDNLAGDDHGQSDRTSFNARRQLWFENIPVPLELIFYNRETYLNSVLEVGVRDHKTGLHMGRAHDLFGLRRTSKVARILFPEKVYPIDLESAFIERDKQMSNDLRGRYKAS